MVKPKRSRSTWGIFLLSRAVDAMYWALAKNRLNLKFKYDYLLMFSLLNSLTGYAYAVEPMNLSPGCTQQGGGGRSHVCYT